MIKVADLREWRGHDVVDEEGRRIGSLESVYVDTSTDEPFFATVTTGLPTRRRLVFVPLPGATAGPDYLKVAYERGVIRKAPSIGVDDVLPMEDEPAIFVHYGLTYAPGAGGGRRLARR